MKLEVLFHLVVLFVITSSKATSQRQKDRIIGGADAELGQFPFAAAIYVQTSDSKFFCTGAFAVGRWVITSGTCVNNAIVFTVRLGSIDLDDPFAAVVSTSQYLLHPDFNPDTLAADVGLIKFQIGLPETDIIKSVTTYALFLDADSEASVVGWGQVSDVDSDLSNRLQYANLTVISNEVCRIYYGNQVTENMTCVEGEVHQGTCIGDNGGPLFLYFSYLYWIVGIASFVSGNGCETVDPSGYTRIGPYKNWLDRYIYTPWDID